MREIVNAIFYVLRGGIAWRLLPSDFPPWPTVYRWLAAFRDGLVFEKINHALVMTNRERVGRDASPSAAIIDGQSVKTTESGGPRGYDAGKKINGRKRHTPVDTDGRALLVEPSAPTICEAGAQHQVPIAEAAVRQIATLYAVETTVRGTAPQARLAARQQHSSPIIAALKPWFEKQLSMISSGSKLAEDIRYGLAHWEGLTSFLDDGRLELDTNPVENAIQPICLTRKSALFAGHEIGAENWALLSSVVATCKLNDVNPVPYLAETLDAIINGRPQSQIEGSHAIAIPENVKSKSIGDRQGAYG
jgi:transposase